MENVQASPPLNKSKGDDWLQRSLAYRTAAFVEAEAAKLTAHSRFLKDDEDTHESPRNEIAIFHRNEIKTCGLLGNGSFSEVHKVWGFQLSDMYDPAQEHARDQLVEGTSIQKDGGCRYVIKHLRRDKANDRKKFLHAATDLVLEAKFLTKLNHSNIIKLRGWAGGISGFNAGTYDGFFLILDCLDETLSQRIRKWRMEDEDPEQGRQQITPKDFSDYREKLDIGLQVASALDYLHDRDIIFRDLKPDNIGFKAGKVKIFDFGLVRELPKQTPEVNEVFHMSGVGTRRYMAPEVCMGQHYNLKADVYSWTMVFYAMLALKPPFGSYNAALHKLLVCEEGVRPNLSPELPVKIQELCQMGWAASHIDRPSIKEICMKLRSMLELTVEQRPVDQPSTLDLAVEQQPLVEQSIMESSLNFIDTYAIVFCEEVGMNKHIARLLRTMEMHMVDGTTGLRGDHSTNYPHYRHLRSSYL